MANIKDVAKAANVSVGTVSRAFNGYQDIKQETRERVLAVARELDYLPNKAAVDLVRGKKPTIGLFLHQLEERSSFDEFGLRIIAGVYDRSYQRGYDISFFTIDAIKEQNLCYVDFLKYHNLVGVIIHGLDNQDPYLNVVRDADEATVLIDNFITDSNMIRTVTTDNFEASFQVAQRLSHLGHRKILFIAGSKQAGVSNTREQGFCAYFEGVENDMVEITKIRCDFNEWQTYGVVHEMFAVEQRYTAIFACSDLMALGAYRALSDLGYTIGEDISIIGFDGVSAMRYTRPTLSTVEQNFYQMGIKSVDLLLDIKQNHVSLKDVTVPFVVRMTSSCMKPADLDV